MSVWTPLNTLLVVCICAVVLSLCLGRVAVALIEAWHGNSAAANASLDAIESAAQKAAAEAVSKFFLAHPQQPPTPIIVVPPNEPTQPQPRVQT